MTTHDKKQKEIFHFILVKPTHYDDNGYPIQWFRTLIPSNSVATIYGLARDCRSRRILGEHVDIKISIIDEISERIRPDRIAAMVRKDSARALVGMIGVQTNQFPRAMDLADRLIKVGLPVCVGGYHVSGYLAMFDELPEEAIAAQKKGISFFTGEAENGRLDEVLEDAYKGTLKPLYNHLGSFPEIGSEPTPFLPLEAVSKTNGMYSAFDMGRGCPFNCSFCTIVNVTGHKSRFRTADDLERIVRENHAIGVNRFFLTDDNMSRNKNWEALFDRLIKLKKEEGIEIRMMAQVDAQSHRIPRFIRKASEAGVDQLFVGIETINEKNLTLVGKNQNKTSAYREMLLAWKKYPIVITAGYIVGLPEDTKESVARDIETIKRELPLDHIYFTNLTALPGSADHKRLVDEGEWLSSDLNQYDTHHCVTKHPKMSEQEWRDANREAWRRFYTMEHMQTILKRMIALGSNKKFTTIHRLVLYSYYGKNSSIHPMDGGILRLKVRRDRRPTMKRERRRVFYPRYVAEVLGSTVGMLGVYLRLTRFLKGALKDPRRLEYTDHSIM